MHDLSLISMCLQVGMELVLWVSSLECGWSRELCIVGVGLVLLRAPNVSGGNVSSRPPLSLGSHLV